MVSPSNCVHARQVPAGAFRGPAREVLTFASQLAAAGDDRLEVTWPALRAVGAGFWLTDSEAGRWATPPAMASQLSLSLHFRI